MNPISKNEFRAALGRFASGITIVTSRDAGGQLHGITVSAFCSVSLQPPMILICIDKLTGSHHSFEESDYFVINILNENQQHLSERFASQLPDKYEGVDYFESEYKIPVLRNALASLECRLVKHYDGGDHTIYVGEISKAHISNGEPLIYFHGNYRKLTD